MFRLTLLHVNCHLALDLNCHCYNGCRTILGLAEGGGGLKTEMRTEGWKR